jgi:hypothetical protein
MLEIRFWRWFYEEPNWRSDSGDGFYEEPYWRSDSGEGFMRNHTRDHILEMAILEIRFWRWFYEESSAAPPILEAKNNGRVEILETVL